MLMDRVGEVVGLDHIVLLVAPKPVLRAESGRELEAGRGKRVDAVREVARDGRGMCEDRDAPAFERAAQLGVGEQAVDSEQGHGRLFKAGARRSKRRVVEVGLFADGCASAQ